MKFEIHRASADIYFRVAEDLDKKHSLENDAVKKTAYMVAAAQNYFYSAVNSVEAVFAEKLECHSFSHENRMNRLLENRSLFSEEIIALYGLVDRDQRNKVTYRGENGDKYRNIKKLANLLIRPA